MIKSGQVFDYFGHLSNPSSFNRNDDFEKEVSDLIFKFQIIYFSLYSDYLIFLFPKNFAGFRLEDVFPPVQNFVPNYWNQQFVGYYIHINTFESCVKSGRLQLSKDCY